MNAPAPMTFDAQAGIGFVTSQRSHIETEVNRTVYPEIQYPFLIPVDTSANPWADTVTYYSQDQFGQAQWVNGNADDIPMAGTNRTQHKTSVYMAGIGYGYGWEEIETARMMGVNLQSEDAMAARRAYEEFVDGVALRGDATKNFAGLINNATVTAASATTGGWTTATEDQILQDVNDAILGVATSTSYTAVADTVLMSNARLNILATRRLGDTQMTILEFIRRNNTYTAMTGQPLTIRAVRGLEDAGSGSTQRLVAYRRAPDVVKLHIPMPHRFMPVFQDGPLHFVVPGVFRLGGVDIRRPKEVRYVDGV